MSILTCTPVSWRRLVNCFHNRKVALPLLSQYPPNLQALFIDDTTQAKNFRLNIRNFNSAFSLASLGDQTSTPPGRGTYCFRLHAQTYHSIGTLHPPEGEDRQYAWPVVHHRGRSSCYFAHEWTSKQCVQTWCDERVVMEDNPHAVSRGLCMLFNKRKISAHLKKADNCTKSECISSVVLIVDGTISLPMMK